MSSLLGDTIFQSGAPNHSSALRVSSPLIVFREGRRSLLQAYVHHQPDISAYSYVFATNVPGTNPALGVAHASDINFGKLFANFVYVTMDFPGYILLT